MPSTTQTIMKTHSTESPNLWEAEWCTDVECSSVSSASYKKFLIFICSVHIYVVMFVAQQITRKWVHVTPANPLILALSTLNIEIMSEW